MKCFHHRRGDLLLLSIDWSIDCLIDWCNPSSEKLPHGNDFRVGPKSDRTPRDNTVSVCCDCTLTVFACDRSSSIQSYRHHAEIWPTWPCSKMKKCSSRTVLRFDKEQSLLTGFRPLLSFPGVLQQEKLRHFRRVHQVGCDGKRQSPLVGGAGDDAERDTVSRVDQTAPVRTGGPAEGHA